jgi:hypothetical protein
MLSDFYPFINRYAISPIEPRKTTRERLEEKKKELQCKLADVNTCLSALENNPRLETLQDLLPKVL